MLSLCVRLCFTLYYSFGYLMCLYHRILWYMMFVYIFKCFTFSLHLATHTFQMNHYEKAKVNVLVSVQLELRIKTPMQKAALWRMIIHQTHFPFDIGKWASEQRLSLHNDHYLSSPGAFFVLGFVYMRLMWFLIASPPIKSVLIDHVLEKQKWFFMMGD